MLQPSKKQSDTFRDQMSLKAPFQINAMDMEQMRLDNIEQPPALKEYSRDSNEEKFYFTDRRTTHPVTNAQMNPNRDLKSDFYSAAVVRAIIKESNTFNVDPNRALAISLTESNLGNKDQNFGHVKERQEFENENKLTPDELEAKQLVYSLKIAQEQTPDYFKKEHKMTDEQLALIHKHDEFLYEKYKQPLDMKENPAFAKTVLSLQEQISKDPDFQRLINENKSLEQKLINHISKK